MKQALFSLPSAMQSASLPFTQLRLLPVSGALCPTDLSHAILARLLMYASLSLDLAVLCPDSLLGNPLFLFGRGSIFWLFSLATA